MAILVDRDTRVVIQGATGKVGHWFAAQLAEHMPQTFVAGTKPGAIRGSQIEGRPVLAHVYDAVTDYGANASLVTVPAANAGHAVVEAIDAGIKLIVVYTDFIPLHEAARLSALARRQGVRLFGPNSAGVVSPGKASVSEFDARRLRPGHVGIVSKSGSLTYEVVDLVHEHGLGISTIACLGGDPILGTRYPEVLSLFAKDEDTNCIVLLGEVGGHDEIAAISSLQAFSKPVAALIVGVSAPPDKPMGHAGALLRQSDESARAKRAALARVPGIFVATDLRHLSEFFKGVSPHDRRAST